MPTSSHKQYLSWAQKKQLPGYRPRTHPGTVFGQCLTPSSDTVLRCSAQSRGFCNLLACSSNRDTLLLSTDANVFSQAVPELGTEKTTPTVPSSDPPWYRLRTMLEGRSAGTSICYHHSTVQSSSKGCCRLEPVTSWYSFFPNSTR